MTKHPRWTRIHLYMQYDVTPLQSEKLYTMLQMSDIETQIQRYEMFLSYMGLSMDKAAAKAIEAT